MGMVVMMKHDVLTPYANLIRIGPSGSQRAPQGHFGHDPVLWSSQESSNLCAAVVVGRSVALLLPNPKYVLTSTFVLGNSIPD